MKSALKKHFLLLLATGFLAASLICWYVFVIHRGKQNDEAYIASVSHRLGQELEKARKHSATIKSEIEKCDKPTFARLLKPSPFPYFVYRNNRLYFWSDNDFIPKQESLPGTKQVRFVSQRSGTFVVYKDVVVKRGDLFEILFFVPLSRQYGIENDYLQSHLNPEIFSDVQVGITNFPSLGGSIYTADGDYLFSLVFPPDAQRSDSPVLPLILILASAGILLLIIYVVKLTNRFVWKYGAGKGLLFLFVTLVLIRTIMLWTDFPFHIQYLSLFNSKFFASSVLSPSLGDLLLNLTFFLIWSIAFSRYYYLTDFVREIITYRNRNNSWLVSCALLVLSLSSFYYVFYLLLMLFTHSQWEMDITVNLDFNMFRIASLLVFGILFSLFVIFSYIFAKLFLFINKSKRRPSWFILVLSAAILGGMIYVNHNTFYGILLTGIVFFTSVLYFRFPKISFQPRYGSYFYLLFAGMACALIASYAAFLDFQRKDTLNKQKFASQLLVKNDVLAEYLLNEINKLVVNDPFIHSRILNPFSTKEPIEQKIKRVYLGDYFDKYDVKIHVFDALGRPYTHDHEFTYWPEIVERYGRGQFNTDYPDIFLMYDPGKKGFKRYLSFNNLKKNGITIGYILIDLKQKRIVPHSVYPELLVDRRMVQPWENKNYSYAIFGDEDILYSYGQYNYEMDFKSLYFEKERLYEKGINVNGYHHLGMKSPDERIIIVSSEDKPFYRFFSNFSFLYTVLLFFILLFVIAWSFNIRFRKIDANFSTKIQIYLNLAFFLPLSIVSVTTLSIISSSYKENLNKTFIKKAEAVSNSINLYLENEWKNPSERRLENILMEKSRFIDIDINLYNNKGQLLFSNQPMIYEAGLLSGLINPVAFSTIRDKKNNIFMQSEQVGTFRYNSVYIAIKSYDSGQLIGVLSIPFFESRQEISQQLIEVLTTILNIFISIFLIFLFISYLVSRWLTVPLDLITEKLRRTTLAEKNEPLEWKSKDEIGLLIGEYNKMLLKLDESKEALSKSEKESAWREMAQQVAHEIKNPLTPMKLSIQHLQRAIKDKKDNIMEMAERTLQMLLDQVDTLNEIATSFSVFAKMPIPRNERFEFGEVIAQIARLHKADASISIDVDIPDQDVVVIGDKKLMGNILSNLILNAVQSVPADRTPELQMRLVIKENMARFSLKDNGQGIPESIKDKVFIPNFSTKYSGSGLGLAIARRGVEHAGGNIWFETIQEQGTTFFIELPLIE